MIRFHCLRSLSLVLAALAVLSIAQPARAARTWRFTGHCEFLIDGPYPGPFNIIENQGWWSKVSPLGQVGGKVTVNLAGVSRSGEILLWDRNKEGTLRLSFEVAFNPSLGHSEGHFTVIPGSGTGKYTGVTGGGWMLYHEYGTNSLAGVAEFDGRITY
jgi:hypothetical protein